MPQNNIPRDATRDRKSLQSAFQNPRPTLKDRQSSGSCIQKSFIGEFESATIFQYSAVLDEHQERCLESGHSDCPAKAEFPTLICTS